MPTLPGRSTQMPVVIIPLVAWVIWHDHPAHPGRFIAQLTTSSPHPYVLVGDTLAEVQEQIPPGLRRFQREVADPPEVVELWLAE